MLVASQLINAIARVRAHPLAFRGLLWFLILGACSLAASTYSVFGHTWDEPEHLAAGIRLLDRGQYVYDMQHPPIARIAMAIGPYLAGARSYGHPGPSGEHEGREVLYGTHNYDSFLTTARLGMLPFLILLLTTTWLWARRWYGEAEAALAVFFVAATPPVIGHAAVAALDIPSAATCTLAMYLMLRWFEKPTLRMALAAGLAAGLAIGTKLSAIPFLGVVTVAWSLASLFNNRKKQWQSTPAQITTQMLAAVLLALTTLIFSYGGKFIRLTDITHTPSEALDFIFGHSGALRSWAYDVAAHLYIPYGLERFVLGLKALQEHNAAGHLSYFMGELRRTGWWNFYLVALSVKTPLPLLILSVSGFGWLAWRSKQEKNWRLVAPLLAFTAILLFCSWFSRINIGVRHVLVLFPLMAMAAASVVVALWHKWSQPLAHGLPIRGLIVAALLWQASALWVAHPDHLAYFNVLADKHPEKILIDSDLDWGQDLRRLKQELRKRNITEFSYIYRGSADLYRENLPPFKFLAPHQRASGWIAVGLLAKATGDEGRGYTWLDAYPPVIRVGKSIDLYYIP